MASKRWLNVYPPGTEKDGRIFIALMPCNEKIVGHKGFWLIYARAHYLDDVPKTPRGFDAVVDSGKLPPHHVLSRQIQRLRDAAGVPQGKGG